MYNLNGDGPGSNGPGYGSCLCGAPDCDKCTSGWNTDKCARDHNRKHRDGQYSDLDCNDCEQDTCDLYPPRCPVCNHASAEGKVCADCISDANES